MIILYCCDKKILVAAILELEPFPQLYGREREVACGDIGLCYATQLFPQFFLVHCRNSMDAESSARKTLYVMVPYIIMCISVEHPEVEVVGNLCEDAGFHDRGIGYEEILSGLVP